MSSKLALLAAVIIVVVVVGVALTRRGDARRDGAAESVPSASAADEAAAAEGTAPAAEGETVGWHHALPEALAEAKARETLVLVDAYADWCGWCTKLEQETLSDAAVQARLRDFALLKLDTDKHPDLAREYGISGLPTTLVLDAAGEVVLSQAGFMGPEEYLQMLDQAAGKG